MPSPARLLGLAFASADLLIEMDGDGTIQLALGAAPFAGLTAEALRGRKLQDALLPGDDHALSRLIAGLEPGRRAEDFAATFADDAHERPARIGLFVLPELAPRISCAVRFAGAATVRQAPAPILAAEDFLAKARHLSTGEDPVTDLAVTFVQMNGLAKAEADGRASPETVARIEARLQAASQGRASAARLSPDRYALLRSEAASHDLTADIQAVVEDAGLDITIDCQDRTLDTDNPLNTLRALRYAVEACLKDGIEGRPELAFSESLATTLRDAEAFRAMVKDGRFELHYQPIVDLDTRAVRHFEALARFSKSETPAGIIHMAEELALVEDFDLAVASKALGRLRQPGAGLFKFAINVSGASLTTDRYVQQLLAMTSSRPEERSRLIVEVTETAALSDIAAADRRLSALRRAGIRVCIDDFGSGSASFDYLRGLSVDAVKIDGRFIQGIDTDDKARTLIAHLVEMCGSLGLTTIAEMIETEATAKAVAAMGVKQGQGWLFGKAERDPQTQLNTPSPIRKRAGAVESWG